MPCSVEMVRKEKKRKEKKRKEKKRKEKKRKEKKRKEKRALGRQKALLLCKYDALNSTLWQAKWLDSFENLGPCTCAQPPKLAILQADSQPPLCMGLVAAIISSSLSFNRSYKDRMLAGIKSCLQRGWTKTSQTPLQLCSPTAKCPHLKCQVPS
ncbi:hypothetical protein llap_4010 [Limosa lapponica baueri]|uniref:Uncharacterized protein n=1 Tax=Limosa lapponica baueri TaxID=1758121 RepID=A0A2I0UI08_LIMLA|nr:hypothetical protein llap_4010 [Limosa lapponica baueri]